MDGLIGVESTLGSGSKFWFELNAAAEPHMDLDPPRSANVEVPVRHGAPVRSTLLYVEDNPANLKLVEQILTRSPDIALLTARNGHKGVELARTHQPDVILMDINLPGISGIEALKILRNDPLTAHIPVIALSANAIPRDVNTGLAAGFLRYLTKPVKVKEFMEVLDETLEAKRVATLGAGVPEEPPRH